jgi:hypothetical protein
LVKANAIVPQVPRLLQQQLLSELKTGHSAKGPSETSGCPLVEQGSLTHLSSSASFKNIGSAANHQPPADNGGVKNINRA